MLEKNKETARRFVLGIVESKLPDELFAEDFAGWSALSGDIDGPRFPRAELCGPKARAASWRRPRPRNSAQAPR